MNTQTAVLHPRNVNPATDAQKFLVAGEWRTGESSVEIPSPWSDVEIVTVGLAGPRDVEDALTAAESSRVQLAETSRWDRANALEQLAGLVTDHSEDLALLLVEEVGKTLRDARGEVGRTISTLRFAADAARNLVGDILPLDAMKEARGKFGYTVTEPIGTVIGIPAANFPLLIAAHKIAPAVGAGCPIILKAPDLTPRVVLRLAELLLEAGWPAVGISVLTGGPSIGEALIRDDRPRLVSFTGSSPIGKLIASQAGFKRLLLELGSNAATIVSESADVNLAASRIVAGAFAAAGQSCISVQRVYVHHARRQELEDLIVEKTSQIRLGTTEDRDADLGPLLTESAAKRVEDMVKDAVDQGAQLLTGGRRTGRFFEATVVSGLTRSMDLHREEVFGPVVALAEFSTFEEALDLANDSKYGLQAGVFTDSSSEAHLAARRLEVGGVHINEISMWRADHMPYGGVKDSGFGKEGPAWAMREMTVNKVVSWKQ